MCVGSWWDAGCGSRAKAEGDFGPMAGYMTTTAPLFPHAPAGPGVLGDTEAIQGGKRPHA
jgi:hypothetical protein